MADRLTARTPGAKRAGPGEYVFNLANVNHILGGPDYSTANGSCVEGDRAAFAPQRAVDLHPRGHVSRDDRRRGYRGEARFGDLRSRRCHAFGKSRRGPRRRFLHREGCFA